jgi:hypothetical protein
VISMPPHTLSGAEEPAGKKRATKGTKKGKASKAKDAKPRKNKAAVGAKEKPKSRKKPKKKQGKGKKTKKKNNDIVEGAEEEDNAVDPVTKASDMPMTKSKCCGCAKVHLYISEQADGSETMLDAERDDGGGLESYWVSIWIHPCVGNKV